MHKIKNKSNKLHDIKNNYLDSNTPPQASSKTSSIPSLLTIELKVGF